MMIYIKLAHRSFHIHVIAINISLGSKNLNIKFTINLN